MKVGIFSLPIHQVMSKQINNELEEQSVMLDDLGNEMDSAQNRVDIALKKMAKVRTSLGKYQQQKTTSRVQKKNVLDNLQ